MWSLLAPPLGSLSLYSPPKLRPLSPWTRENFISYSRHFLLPPSPLDILSGYKVSEGVSVSAPGHTPLSNFALYFVCPACLVYPVNSKPHLDRKVPIRSALPGSKIRDLKAGKCSLRRYDNHEGMQQRQEAAGWKRHLVPSTAQSDSCALFY